MPNGRGSARPTLARPVTRVAIRIADELSCRSNGRLRVAKKSKVVGGNRLDARPARWQFYEKVFINTRSHRPRARAEEEALMNDMWKFDRERRLFLKAAASTGAAGLAGYWPRALAIDVDPWTQVDDIVARIRAPDIPRRAF